MESIGGKIRKVFLSLLVLGMGIIILVSAGTILVMKDTSESANREMNEKAIQNCEEILTKEINTQTLKVVSGISEVIQNKFLQTAGVMEVIGEGLADICENPQKYQQRPFSNAMDIQEDGKQIHWLLPEQLEFTGAIQNETYLLGNIEPYFKGFTDKNEQIQRIYFTSATGINIGYDADYKQKPRVFEGRKSVWYQAAVKEQRLVISEAYVDSFVKELVVTFSIPCLNQKQEVIGVLAVDLLIDDLDAMINDINLTFDGYAMLVSHHRQMIAAEGLHKENATDFSYFLGTNSNAILSEMKKSSIGIEESTIKGAPKYVIYSDIGMADWSAVVVLDKSEISGIAKNGTKDLKKMAEGTREHLNRQLVITCFLWVVVIGVVIVFVIVRSKITADKISSPIVALSHEVRQIGAGNLSYTSHIQTNDEIEELSNAFVTMTSALHTYIENISTLTADKERIATELHVATQIQASMLPRIFPAFPERKDIDIFAAMTPAKEVGGDFYDFFLADEEHLCMVMADVSGKGVPAALFMVVAKILIKDNVLSGKCMSEVFERVNNQLCENNEAEMFVTAFLGILEFSTGEFTYVNAGHNPPAIIRNKGGIAWIEEPTGFILGGMEDMVYSQGKVLFETGDMLFAYTDGVTEAMDKDLKFYDNGRLLEVLGRGQETDNQHRLSAKEVVSLVNGDVYAFMKDADQTDDITMLAFRYLGLEGDK